MNKPLSLLFASFFFLMVTAIVWNHSIYLLPLFLHLRTLIAGLLPTLVFIVPAYTVLGRSKSFASFTRSTQIIWVLFTAWLFAAYLPILLLTIGILSSTTLFAVCGLLLIFSYTTWKRWLLTLDVRSTAAQFTTQPMHLQIAFIISCLLGLLAALLPPMGYDAHEYHLAAAQQYLQHGYWLAFPYNVYAAFPMNVEMLYLYPLAVDSAAGCTVINLQIGLLTAYVVAQLSRQAGWQGSLLLPMTLYLSTGIVLRLLVDAKNDLALAMCAALLFYGYEQLRREASTLLIVLMAGVLGFALGTKYITVLAILFPFLVMVGIDAYLHQQTKWFTSILIIAIGALLFWSPWLLRNWMLYQNPMYPLLTGILGGTPPIFTSVFSAAHASVIYKVNHGLSPLPASGLFMSQFTEFFSLPFRKVITGNSSDTPNALPFGFAGYAMMFPFLFLARSWKNTLAFRVLLFTLTTYAIWFFMTQRNDRFLASLFPIIALIPCIALPLIKPIPLKKTVYALLLCLVGYQQLSQTISLLREETVGFIFFPTFEQEFYQTNLPHYRAIAWLNEQQREGKFIGNVLFIGEAQTFGAQFNAIAPTVFNHHPLEKILDDSFTHIVYNEFELSRLERGYGPLGWKLAPILRYWVGQNKGKSLIQVFDAVPENPGNLVVYEISR